MFADFEPKALDRDVRTQLHESLQYLFDRFQEPLALDRQQVEQALLRIGHERVAPGVFARYYDLVFALQAGRLTQAKSLARAIVTLLHESVKFKVLPYSETVLADDFERFPRLVFSEYSANNPMASPGQPLFNEHSDKLTRALMLIDGIDSGIYAEIQALVLQVYVTVNNPAQQSLRAFGGASSLMTWGALFINAYHYRTLEQVVEFYVHELTHCLLFAISCRQPLVLNPVADSFPSQLRSDPRPMDGLYHSTLVCARLALFLHRWQAQSEEMPERRQRLVQQMQSYRQKFYDGAEVIDSKGQLSKLGAQIFNKAQLQVSTLADA